MSGSNKQQIIPVQAALNLAPADGLIRFELIVSSSISDHGIRAGLRLEFGKALSKLIGLSSASFGLIASYMQDSLTAGATSGVSNKMPAGAIDMRTKLIAYFIPTICSYCQSQGGSGETLAQYTPSPVGAMDAYCIGKDGQYYCYHVFSLLENNDPAKPLRVSFGGISALVGLSCVGKSS